MHPIALYRIFLQHDGIYAIPGKNDHKATEDTEKLWEIPKDHSQDLRA